MAKATLNFIWRYPMLALLAFSCLGVAATASPTRGAESVNGIAAIVNDKVITYSEVRDVVEPRERLLRSQYSGAGVGEKNHRTAQSRAAGFDRSPAHRPGLRQGEARNSAALHRRAGRRRDQGELRRRPERLHQDNGGAEISRCRSSAIWSGRRSSCTAMRAKNVKSNLIVPPAKVEEYYRKHRELSQARHR